MKNFKPTFMIRPFAETNIVVAGFGQNGGVTNWKTLINGPFDKERERLAKQLKLFLRQHNVDSVYAPTTSKFNAQVVSHNETTEDYKCGLHTGVTAEGLDVPTKSAVVFFPADCNTVVIRAQSGHLIANHAGGFSLIDHELAINSQTPPREFASVVDTVVARFGELRDEPKTLSVFIVRGVSASNFGYNPSDETLGAHNLKLLDAFRSINPSVVVGENGGVDITKVIRLQFEKYGVPSHQIQTDATDTYNDLDSDNDYTWWSHERAKNVGNDNEAVGCRNMVLVLNP